MTTTNPTPTEQDETLEREYDHFSIVPFKAICGADEPNQSTSQDPDRVKCGACWQYWRKWVSTRVAYLTVGAARAPVAGPRGDNLADVIQNYINEVRERFVDKRDEMNKKTALAFMGELEQLLINYQINRHAPAITSSSTPAESVAHRCPHCGAEQLESGPVSDTARLAAEEIRNYVDSLICAPPMREFERAEIERIISKHLPATPSDQWRQGMKDAAKEVCNACDNEERYGPARKIEGSTRWWHGDDNIPCEAGGIWHVLANNAATPADNEMLRITQNERSNFN